MNSFKVLVSQERINLFYHLPKAILANLIYGFPTRKLKVIGVTGTDGKTTVTNMIYQILKNAGEKVSMVSTINAEIAGKKHETGFHVTSPDPFLIQKFAKKAVENGDKYFVLEVTSHALDQYRFWGINFEAAVITNITHEHLDYHKTFENYLSTKLKLIKDVRYAIVNNFLAQNILKKRNISKAKIITFGLSEGDFNQKQIKLKLQISGDYNLENALASLAVAFAVGIDRGLAQKALERFGGLEGRMEEIGNNKGLNIVVDFAHTPNAMEQVLKNLNDQKKGRLITVFGCAGKRDKTKRGMMGEISKRLSDFVVITSEDSRGELTEINEQIQKGVEKSGGVLDRNFFIINDRQEAIAFALENLARKGDTIVILGKGHEKSINLDGRNELPWSDIEAVNKVLANG